MPTTGGQIQRERSVDSQIDTQIALVQEPQKRKSDWQVTTMISAWMADCLLLGRVWADICSQRDVSMVLLYSRTEQSRRASLAGLWSWGESWGVAGTIIETVLAITSTTFVIPKSYFRRLLCLQRWFYLLFTPILSFPPLSIHISELRVLCRGLTDI